ncbi:MAG: TSUP family transporter [Verrucomicrobiota bacterium]|nr:TSUP family transporter [Verrucomicrobiota bacterium]
MRPAVFGRPFFRNPPADDVRAEPSKPVALASGAGLGLLAGLTGTGGGIFLAPLLLLMRWARTKTTGAVSALFILVNSISGLIGNFQQHLALPVLHHPVDLRCRDCRGRLARISGAIVFRIAWSNSYSPPSARWWDLKLILS